MNPPIFSGSSNPCRSTDTNPASEPMHQEPKPSPFYDFNIGHILTLVTMIGVGIGIYVNNERTITRFETRIEAHAVTLSAFAARFERLETLGGLAAVDHKLVTTLVAKTELHGEKLVRLEVIASDISQMRGEVSQIRGEVMRRASDHRE